MEQPFRYPKDMIDLAIYAGKYRAALIDQKVPEGLADQLVRDWHSRMLNEGSNLGLAVMRLANVEHVGKREK